MLTAVYWNVNRLQGFLDEVCFELLLYLSLSFLKQATLEKCPPEIATIRWPTFPKRKAKKKSTDKEKIAFATSSARSNSCHSRSIYLKEARRRQQEEII